MAIATALLGVGISGTLLARSQRLRAVPVRELVAWSGVGFAIAAIASYVTADRIPFDAYRIGVDAGQLVWLVIYFLIAGLPFVFAGLAVVATLAHETSSARTPYFVNLFGSAAGAALSLAVLGVLGSAAAILTAAALAALALPLASRHGRLAGLGLPAAASLTLAAVLVAPTGPQVSQYASLQQILRRSDAQLVNTRLTASSQVDLVRDGSVRSAQGLSLTFDGEVPTPRFALTLDGEHPAPVDVADGSYLRAVPLALAIGLRPVGTALVLDPIGGFDVATLRANGARRIRVVQPDRALTATWEAVAENAPFDDPRVTVISEGVRGALRTANAIDLVLWPLRESFRGVAAGTFSIRESYTYTLEAVDDAWRAVSPTGVLAITRWLQAAPSESLRAWATLVHAARSSVAGSPAEHLLAWRSLEVITMLASPRPFSAAEIRRLDAALRAARFDWVFHAGLQPADANQHNVLPNDALHLAFARAVGGQAPEAGNFDVSPVNDDRPYFFHFFQWSQTGSVLAGLGRAWQPFGGAGFLVLVPLAVIATLFALLVVAGPLIGTRQLGAGPRAAARLVFFALLGAGYVFAQIALLQHLILLMDVPTTAFAVGLAAMLGWSGLGSMLFGQAAQRTAWHAAAALAAIAVTLFLLRFLAPAVLGTALAVRLMVAIFALAPLGLALGSVFPAALQALARHHSGAIPWAWAANGVASVAAAFAATIVLVTFGFTLTLAVAAAMYGVAAIVWAFSRPRPRPLP